MRVLVGLVVAVVVGCSGPVMPGGDGAVDAPSTSDGGATGDATPTPLTAAEQQLVGTWVAERLVTEHTMMRWTLEMRADRTSTITLQASTNSCASGDGGWTPTERVAVQRAWRATAATIAFADRMQGTIMGLGCGGSVQGDLGTTAAGDVGYTLTGGMLELAPMMGIPYARQ
jgi:hypothetical protein